MAWNILDNLTSEANPQQDLVNVLNAPSSGFPQFWIVVALIPMFLILTLRTFFKQKETEGRGNIWSSFAVSSFITTLVALIMNLIGILDRITLVYFVAVTAVFGVIYLLIKE